MNVKRVAVIGAGVSGLVSTKTCLEEGLEPVCFELNDECGGIWVSPDKKPPGREGAATVYDPLITNSSKEMMCFSDYPFDPSLPPYLRRHHLLPYYQGYAKHFGVDKHIRYKTAVLNVQPTEDFKETGRWRVKSQTSGFDPQEEIFDAVMICSGLHSEGYIPDVPGLSEFKGDIVHSGNFRNGKTYTDKTAVVVGGSHSAGDVAVEISRHAEKTFLAMKTGCWVLPRQGPNSTPIDAYMNRRIMMLIPLPIKRMVMGSFIRNRMDMDSLGLTADKPLFSTTSLMLNDDIGVRIWCGALQTKPNISRFTENGVVFEDGTKVDHVDAVVFATGFNFRFPFIDKSIMKENVDDQELYLHIFPPRLAHHTVAAIGMFGTIGGNGPAFELQARLAVQVFKGLHTLPDQDTMLGDIVKRKDFFYKALGSRRVWFPPIPYMDMLAEKIGCKPKFTDLLTSDPALAYRFIFGSNYPPFYRLTGPHTWAGARDAIFRGPANTTEPTKTRLVKETHATDSVPMWIFVAIFVLIFALIVVC